MKQRRCSFAFRATRLVWVFALAPLMSFAAESRHTQANVMIETAFTSRTERHDPFNEVTLDVVFTEPGGVERRVPAFWAGGTTWKVRYASLLVGVHRFRTECSDPKDAGLHGVTGAVEVKAYKGDNPLYIHGPLRVVKGSRYLEHADGTPFFWLGDTWWMGLTKRLVWPEEFKTLTQDRKRKGFNVIQIVAGLYPDMPPFDERGANEAGLPWEKDYARIRPEYFDAADRRILYLADQGFVPCVVGAWGFHLPFLGREKTQQHERYLYARWGALPMVWCVTGETNMPFYTNPGFPQQGAEKQMAEWEKVIGYCRSINGFGRLITAHPAGNKHLSMRELLTDPMLIDFDMLQTPHGQMEVLPKTLDAVRFSYGLTPPMPVVNAEPSYEMLMDKTPPEIARLIFWVCWTNGVKGYTYGANGIWQMNRRGKPYGNSPWGGTYGKISWDEAMNLAGSTQVSLGKKLLSQYAWEKFEPHAAWVSWAASAMDAPLGDWIWFPEGDPAHDAPVAARYFRKSFELPEGAKVRRAALQCAADDKCTVWLNGTQIGSNETWSTLSRFEAISSHLKPGRNVLAIRAENVKAAVAANPAGLIVGMAVELEDGKRIEVKSDGDWLASQEVPPCFQQPGLDDSGWPKAKVAARYGAGPWGKFAGGPDQYVVPYAMGIDRAVRVIYVPQARAVLVKELEPDIRYSAYYFDPATGERTPGPKVNAVAGEGCRIDPPAFGHDWVLVLEARN